MEPPLRTGERMSVNGPLAAVVLGAVNGGTATRPAVPTGATGGAERPEAVTAVTGSSDRDTR